MIIGFRINKNTAFQQIPVKIGHQRTDIPGSIRPARLFIRLLAIFDVLLYSHRKFFIIPLINRINCTVFRCFYIRMRKTKLSDGRVKRKPVYPIARRVH